MLLKSLAWPMSSPSMGLLWLLRIRNMGQKRHPLWLWCSCGGENCLTAHTPLSPDFIRKALATSAVGFHFL